MISEGSSGSCRTYSIARSVSFFAKRPYWRTLMRLRMILYSPELFLRTDVSTLKVSRQKKKTSVLYAPSKYGFTSGTSHVSPPTDRVGDFGEPDACGERSTEATEEMLPLRSSLVDLFICMLFATSIAATIPVVVLPRPI